MLDGGFADVAFSLPVHRIGGFMRLLVCLLLLGCPLLAQNVSSNSPDAKGSFFIDGIVYQYATGVNCTVVAAAHSVINHKFLAVKVRIYNWGKHSFTVTPDDMVVEDAVGGHRLTSISGADLARRMRKPYNMARYAVNGAAGPPDGPITSDMLNPQLLAMMRAMAAQTSGGAMPAGRNVLYTDTPGALDDEAASGPVECDEVCRLRNREAQVDDPLVQLQRQNSPDKVEDVALRANTVPPHANVAGVLYYPLNKLSESAAAGEHGKKGRLVRVTVPVMGDSFQFELPVE